MRKRWERMRHAEQHDTAFAKQRAELDRWRREVRPLVLWAIAAHTTNFQWSRTPLATLLDELSVDDDFGELVGDPERLPVRRYPQAVAMALAIRHSWRPDDLAGLTRRLGLSLAAARPGPSAPHAARVRHGPRTPHAKPVRCPKPARR